MASYNLRLKVMALTSAPTLNRLYMDNFDIDLVRLSNISEAIDRLQIERFDIILIDSLLDEAAKACQYMCKIAYAPVALFVREKDNNWKKFSDWEVDGFVFEGSSKAELAARIRATSRRKIMVSKIQ